ncbi:hypothetical protein JL49_13280 [Pseudoalteromonas luteoviolacea]|nr:hypothetical protein JL49_13280 [Pseudoalteromonas luteoviolacea]
MSVPVTVYSSQDTGAPQFVEGKPSELFNVLKSCLIDGYGSKPPAGWQLQSLSESEMVINNHPTEASGFTARIASERGDDSPKQCVSVTPMKSWTGTEALLPGYMKVIYIASDARFFHWVLIASKSAFYFFKGWRDASVGGPYQFGAKETAVFLGDIKPVVANDLSIFLAYGADGGKKNHTFNSRYGSGDYDFGYDLGLNGNEDKTVLLYDRALDGSPIDYRVAPMLVNSNPKAPAPPTDGLYLPVFVMNDKDIGTQQFLRGTLPGLIHTTEPMHRNETPPFFTQVNDQTHYAVVTIQEAVGLYINCEAW